MSGFQTYLDNAQTRSGLTPQQVLDLAASSGRSGATVGELTAWLKAEHGLGHGHAANLAQLISKGPDVIAATYNGGAPLRLDGPVG